MKIEKYDKDKDFSFSFGAFPTFELVKNKAQNVVAVVYHSKLKITGEVEKLFNLCRQNGIELLQDDKTIEKIANKENVFVMGIFKKYAGKKASGNNLVLVNPSDMGNLGTIMRTALGFGIKNLAIVKPAVDYFNPKVVRASMGAIFSLNIVEFENLADYLKTPNKKYFFMLNGKQILGKAQIADKNFDLVFGNEAHGLPAECENYGETILIKHSNKIDSLNLPISVGIALYETFKG